MEKEFKLPDLGENVTGADVVSVMVAEGHVIKENQNVLELETDKAAVEIPCPFGGRVVKVHVGEGDHVKIGDSLLTIDTEGDSNGAEARQAGKSAAAPAKTPAKAAAPAREEPAADEVNDEDSGEEEPAPPPAPRKSASAAAKADAEPAPSDEPADEAPPRRQRDTRRPAPASPAIRRMARELGVDLHQVSGSGPGGRISEDDVKAFVRRMGEAAMAGTMAPGAAPALPDFSQWGPVERKPMSGIRRKTAESMSLAWRMAPRVTQNDEADITELEAARKRFNDARGDKPGKVTMTVLAIKAAVAALKAYPQFNASLDAQAGVIVFKKYFHIGVAVDTENGLLVPVIRDADRKSVIELAVELEDMAARARARKLGLEEMRGGSFTITNLGGIGGTSFTPIVNYPEVAILGMARAGKRPAFDAEGNVAARLMLPLCLSYDHRAIDGADGARFCRAIAEMLTDPMRLLLEG